MFGRNSQRKLRMERKSSHHGQEAEKKLEIARTAKKKSKDSRF